MIYFVTSVSTIIAIIVTLKLHEYATLKSGIEKVNLRLALTPIMHADMKRVWEQFFEMYLFIFVNSKTIPTDKEFLKFRTAYGLMFYEVVGINQFKTYEGVFGSETAFKEYLNYVFETYFKDEFVKLIIDPIIFDDGATPNTINKVVNR